MNDKTRAAMQQALEALQKAEMVYAVRDVHPMAVKQVEQAITAMREALAGVNMSPTEPTNMNLNCKSAQARLATSWGYVKAEQAEQKQVAVLDITYGREPECYATPNAEDLPEGTYRLYAAPVQQAEQETVHESLQIAAVALQDIACSSQTNNLLWWQIRAREAQKQIAERLTNSAPAEPVKQEPVAYTNSDQLGYLKDPLYENAPMAMWSKPFDKRINIPLYAAPVRTKDLTYDEVWEVLHDKGLMEGIRAVIAADREKNRGSA